MNKKIKEKMNKKIKKKEEKAYSGFFMISSSVK